MHVRLRCCWRRVIIISYSVSEAFGLLCPTSGGRSLTALLWPLSVNSSRNCFSRLVGQGVTLIFCMLSLLCSARLMCWSSWAQRSLIGASAFWPLQLSEVAGSWRKTHLFFFLEPHHRWQIKSLWKLFRITETDEDHSWWFDLPHLICSAACWSVFHCAGVKESFRQSNLVSSCSLCTSYSWFSISSRCFQRSKILFLSVFSHIPHSSIAWRKEIQEDELTELQAVFSFLQNSSHLLMHVALGTKLMHDIYVLYKIFSDICDNNPLHI